MIIAVAGISVPSFIMATVLQYVFALQLGIFPVARWESFMHTVLPALALASTPTAFIARLTRSSMLEVLSNDYIKTAKAKGLSQSAITVRHTIRNAMLPVVSYIGPLAAALLREASSLRKSSAFPGLVPALC